MVSLGVWESWKFSRPRGDLAGTPHRPAVENMPCTFSKVCYVEDLWVYFKLYL